MIYSLRSILILIFGMQILISGCCYYRIVPTVECGPELATINIIDQNGVSETISNEDRLAQYSNVDFLCSQPYRKVLRVFKRDEQGNIAACVTSYYPNGQIQQYLDIVNGRACGEYRSWHENGVVKIETTVIGGEADLTTGAEQSWLFDGTARAWDDKGVLQGEFCYNKGKIEGDALYFHANGELWKKTPMVNGLREGVEEVFLSNGAPLQSTTYCRNEKDGSSIRYWSGENIAADECYSRGKLISGLYYDQCGQKIAEVCDGNGVKAIFGKEHVKEFHEYRNGLQEGFIKELDLNGECTKLCHIKNDQKNGEEIEYFPGTSQPQLSITWSDGKIHGVCRTYYRNGNVECQREMALNKKNGILTAWYSDGSMMMIEEYDQDKLAKGEYYKRGEYFPVSTIHDGKGTGTFYDSEGVFLRRVAYVNGKPDV
jgi:antitoxin component YwqK of YwqJK toxin-antitoxin module